MPLTSLRPRHIARYREIAGLLLRHGLVDVKSLIGIDRGLVRDSGDVARGDPGKLADDLEALGPTFVKLGQLLASRADLLPEPYLDALGRLQDDVEPLPFDAVAAVVREELGMTVDEAFASFEREPVASASLGQVHRARLGDGRTVAVKVQRPGASESVNDDLEAVHQLARLLDEHTDIGRRFAFAPMVEELRDTLLLELDYRQEAQNLTQVAESLAKRERLVVPRSIEPLCCERVLTMEFVEGSKLTELSSLGRTDLDGRALAEELCTAYVEMMLVDGRFHADPHPGNVLLTPDGRLALVDLGMVARLTASFRNRLLQLVLALADGDADAMVDVCIQLGTRLDDFDRERFEREAGRLASRFRDAPVDGLPLGRLVFGLGRAAAGSGLRPPAELASVGKTLTHLDEVGRALDPRFDANAVIRTRLTAIAGRQLLDGLHPRRAAATAFELKELAQHLPRKVNAVLEALTERQLEVRVRAFDESRMMGSLRRIGSRITLGLIFAALIVGASLVMGIETGSTIWGYPAVAVVLLAIGVGGSVFLVLSILLDELRRGKR